MLEGRGISDLIKEYSTFIYEQFESGENKIQLDFDFPQLPLIDLRVEFFSSGRYHGKYDPTNSTISGGKLHDIYIQIEVDYSNIDKSKVTGIISHELTHINEYFNIQKEIINGIEIKPHWIKIKSSYKELSISESSPYYYFIYLLYLSLDNEMNARISQVYHYLYELKSEDENELFDHLKKHQNWKYYQMLNNFDYGKFVNDCVSHLGRDVVEEISTSLISKLKSNELNKTVKSLSFINKKFELFTFYKDWSNYFKMKSDKHLEKFKYLIKEVIEDHQGKRPFNESFRLD